jgi:hypothetical protein
MSNIEKIPSEADEMVANNQIENNHIDKLYKETQKEEEESNIYDIIDKKTNADDNLSSYFIDFMDFPKRKNRQLVKLFKDFLFRFMKFYGIRALISLCKKIMKLKFQMNKFSLKDLLDNLFNAGNLKTGIFLSIMPFIYSLFTEVLFDLKNKNNISRESLNGDFQNNSNLKNKIIVLLSGFAAALVGISFAEKGVKIMNYIILSIMVRAIHSLIVVYLKNQGKETDSKFWAFITFYIACFGFLFLAYYHPGYKPILKLYSNYANFEGNEKEEVYSIIRKLNIFKQKDLIS